MVARLSSMLRYAVLGGALYSTQVFAVAPIANSDERTVTVNFSATINVLNNDTDPDGDDIFIVSTTEPQNGSVLINEDGGITYTPNTDFTGVDSFTYIIEDVAEVPERAQATVTINVVPTDFSSDDRPTRKPTVADSLADACDRLSGRPNSELSEGQIRLATRCDDLRELALVNPEAVDGLVELISPEETLALMKVVGAAAKMQSNAVAGRIRSAGRGIQQAGPNGLAWAYNTNYASAGDESLQSPFNLFASVQIKKVEREKTQQENGYEQDAIGGTIGFDYALNSDFFVGAALGSTSNTLDYNDDQGGVETSTITLIGFFSYNMNNLAFDFQLGFDQSDYEVNRVFEYEDTFIDLEVTSSGETTGSQYFILSNLQYSFNRKALTFSPYVQLEYSDGTIDAYQETNSIGFDVFLNERNSQETLINLGFNSQYVVRTKWGVLIPSFDFEVVNSVSGGESEVEGRFVFAPEDTENFVLTSDEVDTLFYRSSLGFSAVFPRGTSAFLNYQQLIDKEYFDTWQANAGVRIEF